MNAFFICGNKRSGSSLLVRLLNIHPGIFISHESDIIWILYRRRHKQAITPYPSDDPAGMEYTQAHCSDILNSELTLQEKYYSAQLRLMKEGFSVNLPPMSKKELLWIGDKKPFQYADPTLTDFILSILPDAHFIHLVRHPFAVAKSAKAFKGNGGYIWGKVSPEEVVRQWTFNEKRILDLKQKTPHQILDIRYEDIATDAEDEMERLFSFLGVPFTEEMLENAGRIAKYKPKFIPKLSCDEETLSLMALYGYENKEDFSP